MHTNPALGFIQNISESDDCTLKFCFLHTAQYRTEQSAIANVQAGMLGEELKSIQLLVKDTQQFGKGNLAGAIIEEEILTKIKQ